MNTVQQQLPIRCSSILGPDGTGCWSCILAHIERENHDLGTLRSIQDWYIRYKSSVDGVAEVASIGGFVKQYQVDVNPTDLRGYNLTVSDVVNAVQRSNNEVGGKILEVNDAEYFVRGQGYIKTIEDVENTVIRGGPKRNSNHDKRCCQSSVGGDIRRGSLELNGEGQVVGGIVVMRTGKMHKK
ncbi:MAG: efflux RND transporter permease subunit [Ignavibacteriales bacterium]|nr:efflux RND transporter permease subunit [Ignavibacteriales bacterium]